MGFVYTEQAVPLRTGVTLFTSVSPGPAWQTLLVIHGGPDWDHTYLREPLDRLGGGYRVVLPDLRGCGRSTAGLADAPSRCPATCGACRRSASPPSGCDRTGPGSCPHPGSAIRWPNCPRPVGPCCCCTARRT